MWTDGGTQEEGLSEYYQSILPNDSSLRMDHLAYQSNISLDAFKDSSAFSKYDGSGYTVVIIDTGIDYDITHFGPDLNGDGIGDKIVFLMILATTRQMLAMMMVMELMLLR